MICGVRVECELYEAGDDNDDDADDDNDDVGFNLWLILGEQVW